jgi:hypothetical protein
MTAMDITTVTTDGIRLNSVTFSGALMAMRTPGIISGSKRTGSIRRALFRRSFRRAPDMSKAVKDGPKTPIYANNQRKSKAPKPRPGRTPDASQKNHDKRNAMTRKLHMWISGGVFLALSTSKKQPFICSVHLMPLRSRSPSSLMRRRCPVLYGKAVWFAPSTDFPHSIIQLLQESQQHPCELFGWLVPSIVGGLRTGLAQHQRSDPSRHRWIPPCPKPRRRRTLPSLQKYHLLRGVRQRLDLHTSTCVA